VAREELKVSHPGLPRELDRYLVPTERVIFARRLHWFSLWKPITALAAGTILLSWVSGAVPEDVPFLGQGLLIAWTAVLAYFVWEIVQYYLNRFVGTDRRLIMTMGVLTRKVAMMPLAKVTDMSYNRTPGGRILGYGTFVLESAGQDQALSTIEYVPEPDLLYRRINEVLFSPTAPRGPVRPTASGERLPVHEPAEEWWRRR
jgi:membrane protein YdbS with pleckstrin-like domain